MARRSGEEYAHGRAWPACRKWNHATKAADCTYLDGAQPYQLASRTQLETWDMTPLAPADSVVQACKPSGEFIDDLRTELGDVVCFPAVIGADVELRFRRGCSGRVMHIAAFVAIATQ